MLKRLALLLDPAPAATAPAAGGGTAAPAAPAAAPAKTDATPAPAGGDSEPNPFDALDGMIAKSRGKEPPKEEKSDLSDKSAEKKTDEKAGDKAPDKKDDAARQIQSGPKALREQLEKTNGELKTFKEKVAAYEAKIAEFEGKGKDTTALAERLATIEKQHEAVLAENRALKHESSPEFKAKYEAPFSRAAESAKKIVSQLMTAPKENEDGTTTPGRPATWDDFAGIFSLPYGKAQEEAEKLFGKSERIVMSHYDKLHGLQEERDAALQEERNNWKASEEKEKAEAVIREQNREKQVAEIGAAWTKLNQELAEKHADIFAANPKEAEESKFVTEAHAIFDAKPKTLQQQMVKDAYIRNHLAASYLARHRLSKANDRIAELETALAESKGSRPGATKRPGGAEQTSEKSWSQDLKEALA